MSLSDQIQQGQVKSKGFGGATKRTTARQKTHQWASDEDHRSQIEQAAQARSAAVSGQQGQLIAGAALNWLKKKSVPLQVEAQLDAALDRYLYGDGQLPEDEFLRGLVQKAAEDVRSAAGMDGGRDFFTVEGETVIIDAFPSVSLEEIGQSFHALGSPTVKAMLPGARRKALAPTKGG